MKAEDGPQCASGRGVHHVSREYAVTKYLDATFRQAKREAEAVAGCKDANGASRPHAVASVLPPSWVEDLPVGFSRCPGCKEVTICHLEAESHDKTGAQAHRHPVLARLAERHARGTPDVSVSGPSMGN